ncbi:MAG: hypothetical protein CMN85_10890 [Spongiibacteraceae bacterium]|uniref:hypothetical protein n=1 Tax=uncultured Haliea sp. TaxID=622616 RepID=UPI000C41FA74|nr:hypothetical protein [Spongiibacteraceae bacterium]|tara:strand:+ start:21172 stop:21588 length:417 start_codon:yes stop_codon:yes gene_type:complete
MNLSKNTKLVLVSLAAASAGTAINSASVDMQGFDGVVFFGSFGKANASNFANAAQSDDDTTFTDLAGTKVAPGDDDDSFLIDIYRPGKRYVRCEIDRGGANTATGDIYALLYGARNMPVTHGSTIDAETHVSPAEGTA